MGLKTRVFNRPHKYASVGNIPIPGSSPERAASKLEDLSSIRIIQKNLIYAKNIPASIATEKILTKQEHFGQYGSIQKCIIVPSTEASSTHYKAYITFATEEEASRCVSACHNLKIGSKTLEVTLGTTRYCTFFINKTQCPRKGCFFLHLSLIHI